MGGPPEPTRTNRDLLAPDAAQRFYELLQDDGFRHIDSLSENAIPGYRIERLLGEGGGGVVYLAWHSNSDRPVALKRIRLVSLGAQRSSAATQRAYRELHMLEETRLPCTPRVLDYGVHAGDLWIATEYVEGDALDREVESQGRDTRQRVELLARVADAVQMLHERGLIHRDLKPSNILVTKTGQVVIIDLGIAALTSGVDQPTLTETGVPIGTPAYMSPEQARGERPLISTRSDVYALGAIGIKLLTGHLPHEMPDQLAAAVARVGNTAAREARCLSPSLPLPIARVLDRSVAFRPSERYESAASFAADLRRWLAGEPVEAMPASRWQRSVRWFARHPVLASTVASILAVCAVIGGTWAFTYWLSFTPDQLAVDEDRRTVRLLSPSGRELDRWGGGASKKVCEAKMFRDTSIARSPVAVLALLANADTDPCGALLILDAYQSDRPIWSWRGEEPDVPVAQRVNLTPGWTMTLSAAQALDIVGDADPEIVAIFTLHPRSLAIIRVYSLNGGLLYEAFHDGQLDGFHYLRNDGVLIFAGVNSERPLSDFCIETQRAVYPHVVFAIQPRPGWIVDDVRREPASSAAAPLWYKWLAPAEAQDRFNRLSVGRFEPLIPQFSPDSRARLWVRWEQDIDSGFDLFVNASGEVVVGPTDPNKKYAIPPSQFELRDWPPQKSQ